MSLLEAIEIASGAALFAAALCFGTMALAAILTAVVRHPWAALWHVFAEIHRVHSGSLGGAGLGHLCRVMGGDPSGRVRRSGNAKLNHLIW